MAAVVVALLFGAASWDSNGKLSRLCLRKLDGSSLADEVFKCLGN